jgi:hypothetical protein
MIILDFISKELKLEKYIHANNISYNEKMSKLEVIYKTLKN